MLRNPVIRDGYVSSEPIGSHTGFAPRKTDDARLRNTLPTRTCRPRSAPSWIRTARVSDAIGWHPRPETPDVNDTAAMHFEAQFAHRFGEAGHLGAVLSTKGTGAAAEFQKRFIERAAAMQPTNEFEFDETEGKTVRDDGQLMEKMEFDTIYSNRFSEKASESAFGRDLVPVIDLRRDALTRPKQYAPHVCARARAFVAAPRCPVGSCPRVSPRGERTRVLVARVGGEHGNR